MERFLVVRGESSHNVFVFAASGKRTGLIDMPWVQIVGQQLADQVLDNTIQVVSASPIN